MGSVQNSLYIADRREEELVREGVSYKRSSVALQRERLLDTYKQAEMLDQLQQQKEVYGVADNSLSQDSRDGQDSITRLEFLKSKRAGRRFAVARSSMIAEVKSYLSLML